MTMEPIAHPEKQHEHATPTQSEANVGVLAALLAAGGQVEAAAAQRWLRTVDCERALLGGLETRSAVPVLSSSSDEETMTKKKQGEEALSQMGFEQVDRNRWRLRSPALPTPESESERPPTQ